MLPMPTPSSSNGQALSLAPSKPAEVTTSLQPISQTDSEGVTSAETEQKLPNEVIDHVLECLAANSHFQSLATAARVNNTIYDLAIPKLYRTVIRVTDKNQDQVIYGCTPTLAKNRHAVEPGSNGFPSRKDIATSYVRKLILDTTPSPILVQCFPSVDQVEVTPYCLDEDLGCEEEESVHQFTKALASQQNSTMPLHITFCAIERGHALHWSLCSFLDPDSRQSPASATHPITYEIFGLTILEDTPWLPLITACRLQAVVHFDSTTRVGIEEATVAIGKQLFQCLLISAGCGQLYLCDIPDIVLSPDEIDLADNVEEAAKLKLFNITLPSPRILDLGGRRPEWEKFNARIHLVKSGFRPSKADMKMVNRTTSTSESGAQS